VWPEFDREVLGGNYSGHHGVGPKTTVKAVPGAEKHPVLTGVRPPFAGHGSLYKVSPLAPSATPLLTGSLLSGAQEPVAWVNRYGKARRRLLSNAILWALDKPVPAE
jgi:hypothetical protein